MKGWLAIFFLPFSVASYHDENRLDFNFSKPEELEEFYRQRNTLKVCILPEDIAEAVFFFASERAAKTTGCMLNVDGGVTAAFPR